MLRRILAALAAVALFAAPAFAQGDMVKGEVTKVDKAAGKVTIKHGPIRKLDMDSMTMVFRVADPAMLDRMKPGDKIEFEADRVNGAITVTRLGKGG
ncbi:MAG: copper-binding protein [Enhydrobacter sp.]|nr:MAG: copper-binding protein [Enhydrobacter sp.]